MEIRMWLLFISICLFIGVRLFPYLYSAVPLGYDAGFYLYLFKQYAHLPAWAYFRLDAWIINQFPIGVSLIGRIVSAFMAPEQLLVPLILAFSVMLFITVFVFSYQQMGKRAALWSSFFLSVSALQFRTYWYYYAKQIFGSSLLFLGFWFMSRSSLLAIPFCIYISVTHEPVFIILCLALAWGCITDRVKRRYYVTVAVPTILAAVMYYLPAYRTTLGSNLSWAVSSLIPQSAGGTMMRSSGSFYGLVPSLILALPYLPLAGIGLVRMWRKDRKLPFWGALSGTLVIILFGLYLWQRFIIFADLFAVLLAGGGMEAFLQKMKNVRHIRLYTGIYIAFLVLIIGVFVKGTGQPPIADDELREIAKLRETEPGAYVLVTDQAYTPYVYGWSDRKPIAPGYSQYDIYWSIPEWHRFWESGDRQVEQDLLLKLPKPLYIYSGDMQPMYSFNFSGECFEKVNWRTYKFVCEK